MDREARIVIIGAGAAGLSAAVELKRLGFRRVTVLERRPDHLGGKCFTVDADGVPLDTGAVYVLPNYPEVTRLAKEVGVKLRRCSPYVQLGPDGRTRPFGHTEPPTPFLSKAAEYLRLGGELLKFHQLLLRPLGEVDPGLLARLSLPFGEWAERHRLRYFRDAAYPLMRSFGFGYEEQRIPAAYIFKAISFFAQGGNLLNLWNVSGIPLYQVAEGYGELWRKLAEPLEVHLKVGVRKVERTKRGGTVHTTAGAFHFDRLLLACSPERALTFLDAHPEEAELFSPVRTFPVWQLAVQAEGIPEAVLLDRNQAYARIGSTMILFRYHPGSSWYYLFGYVGEGQTDARIIELARETLEELGGRMVGPPRLTRWGGYFPHYGSKEVAAGYHARLEALQGRHSTWHAGELLSGIGVEAASSYARQLVRERFA
ncbi:MAG TPA: FAD-dependent oxidoreductase [Myxococcaceae bacterium]|nr:FAD-dependent oxidoreductase [Myxococcaceae bacterium]